LSRGQERTRLRYAVDESPPHLLAAGLGLQVVILIIAGIVLTPTIVLRAAGDPEGFLPWVVFMGLVVCGITTMVQARPIGRFGAGYVLFMGTSGAFIAVSIDAVRLGGMPLLATVIVASSLIQFLFSYRLSALRTVITPTVGGTMIMLIAVTVFPVAFRLINETPPDVPAGSLIGPLTAIVTFVVILGISLFAKGATRLWGPIVGVGVGSVWAYVGGAFDLTAVFDASWFGLPSGRWPGLDLNFGTEFWWLLILFSIVTIVGAIETYGDGVAIQRLSKRTQDPIDFRPVQGAVNADGLGNLLSGLAGTLPNTTYSTSLSVVDLTGVAARQVGLYGGLFMILIGFSPKVSTILMLIPSPIAGAYIIVLLVLLFMHGLRMVTEDGLSYENGMIVCIAFWLGVGFQNQQIFPEFLPFWSRGLLDNGMAAGGILAILLSMLVNVRRGKSSRIEVPARIDSIQVVHGFLARIGKAAGWDRSAMVRLDLACEEALLYLIVAPAGGAASHERNVRLSVTGDVRSIELEFVSGGAGMNLENAARKIDRDAPPTEQEVGLRVLQGLADDVRHDQFYGVDVLIVRLDSRPL
jgi:NCS2 family nucleobase:cation symporter-2/xanthine permease XanP